MEVKNMVYTFFQTSAVESGTIICVYAFRYADNQMKGEGCVVCRNTDLLVLLNTTSLVAKRCDPDRSFHAAVERPAEIQTISTGQLALWLDRPTPDQDDMSQFKHACSKSNMKSSRLAVRRKIEIKCTVRRVHLNHISCLNLRTFPKAF